MIKKILILSFYYAPDLRPGAFRIAGLIEALNQELDANNQAIEIDLITTQPMQCDPETPLPSFYSKEGRVNIYRICLPSQKDGFVNEAWLFIRFSYQVFKITRKKNYILVFATTARLMTGLLGTWVARGQKAKLYLDIRDNFVSNIKEIFSQPIAGFFGCIFSWVERFIMWQAQAVNLNSPGFHQYFATRYPKKKFRFFTNGLDMGFFNSKPSKGPGPAKENKVQVVYAGNLGKAQGLHSIIPFLAQHLKERADFTIIGAGRSAKNLKDALEALAINNVTLRAPMSRAKLANYYAQADVLFLHLDKKNCLKQVLPSKLFEYAATGKPIWAGVDGYAQEFIQTEINGAVVFKPGDVESGVQAFFALDLQGVDRSQFVHKYLRSSISTLMARDLLYLAQETV